MLFEKKPSIIVAMAGRVLDIISSGHKIINFSNIKSVVFDEVDQSMRSIYKKELCISPMPSLALHFTNVNSIYGLSPNVNWKRLWEENEN